MATLCSTTVSVQNNLGLKLLCKTEPNFCAVGKCAIHTRNASLFRSHGNSPVELHCYTSLPLQYPYVLLYYIQFV